VLDQSSMRAGCAEITVREEGRGLGAHLRRGSALLGRVVRHKLRSICSMSSRLVAAGDAAVRAA
jgi:hypothetical protein